MENLNSLKIVKSSAGSGKTFTLVREYLRLVLQSPEDYRHVLAITFTNKAAGEMKERIITSLVDLSRNKPGAMMDALSAELTGINIPDRANRALKNILHDYSAFSVSTIDSFFQKLLRALAREMHLPLRMEVEVGLEDAITEVTDRLLREVGNDKDLTEWLTDLVLQKLDDAKGWNIENDIEFVAKELFRERREETVVLTREKIREIYKYLASIRSGFEKRMKEIGHRATKVMENYDLQASDFSYGKGGVIGYFEKIRSARSPEDYKLKTRAEDALSAVEKWYTKKALKREEVHAAVEEHLMGLLQEAHAIVRQEYQEYITANEALRRIYIFGIVNDISKKFTEYRQENNVILLADTPRLLSEVITGQDAPFIYEKAGNRFKHLLIDEFQDTSVLQWKNLLPLITNALGSGHMVLVVGDAKQSIYRWRGGNMQLLVSGILQDLRHFQSVFKHDVLSANFRSKKEVVEFNNAFFEKAPGVVSANIDLNNHSLLATAYGEDLKQEISKGNTEGGFVSVEFVSAENSDNENEEDLKWKDVCLRKTSELILDLLDKGFEFRDIAILVRSNKEGNTIANHLFDNGITQIISPDSLLIKAAPAIRFLISCMRFLSDPTDAISRGEILLYQTQYAKKNTGIDLHLLFSDYKVSGHSKKGMPSTLFDTISLADNAFNKVVPEEFSAHLLYLSKLPVYELSEHLIRIFGLNNTPDAYIQRFQDLVLDYAGNFNSSLDGFIEWWDDSTTVENCSVMIPENENAIRIMTVHRSKGLQFPVVIMPFCDWKFLPKPNELLWVNAKEEPYNSMGPVAVTTSNRLRDTYFKDSYLEEVNQTIVDNINLLYVAFTRAEERLHILSPKKKEGELSSISHLLASTLQAMELTQDGTLFTKGDAGQVKQKKKSKSEKEEEAGVESVQLSAYPSNRWQEKISISAHSKDLVALTNDKKLEKINYGILVHTILSNIRLPEEISKSIDTIIFEGLIAEKEKEKLLGELTSLLSVPEIRSFFSPEWKSRAEREIILPTGEILRPDRVLFKTGETAVIDFKTGKKLKSHEEQVSRYASVLAAMGYSGIRKYLIYIPEKEVLEVS